MHKKFYGYTGATLVKYFVTVGTGLFTGACAYAIAQSSSWLIEKRLDMVERNMNREGLSEPQRLLYGYGTHTVFSVCLVILPGLLVQFWTPQAVGAGVSLVMAYLNGNHIPYLLHYHVMVTKVLGTICACASGLPLGPEGPMVQIGASLGSTLTYCGCLDSQAGTAGSGCCLSGLGGCCLGWGPNGARRRRKKQKSSILKSSRFDLRSPRLLTNKNNMETFCEQIKLQDDADHREIISAGAAAGLAAAFGSPIGKISPQIHPQFTPQFIHNSRQADPWFSLLLSHAAGGVMFSWEEASSFWSRKVTWRCFLCTAIAVLTLALLRGRASIGLLSFPDFSTQNHMHTEFLWNFPFLTVTAIAAGLIGAFFNSMRHRFGKIRVSLPSSLFLPPSLLLPPSLPLPPSLSLLPSLSRSGSARTLTLLSLSQPKAQSHFWRITELLVTTACCMGVMFLLSLGANLWGGCIEKPQSWPDDFGMRFTCKSPGQINDLYTLFFSNPDEVIDRIFGAGSDECQVRLAHPIQTLFSHTTQFVHTLPLNQVV